MQKLVLSNLSKTWLLDVDGTIVKHNGYKNEQETLLEGVKKFWDNISPEDKVIILTSREKKYIKQLEQLLQHNSLRYDHIISDLPFGERILINDKKPSGLQTAYAINKERDSKLEIDIKTNKNL